jgi:phenylalanyl-tRNA synthetase beta chain
LTYAGVEPKQIHFIPLGEEKLMDGNQILQQTPKGREYGDIIKRSSHYPLLFDSEGRVLSLPPIINSITTTVTEETQNLLLDVTGTDRRLLKCVLNIIATSLADRGGKINSAKIIDGKDIEYTPDLRPSIQRFACKNAGQLIGIKLKPQQVTALLKKMRYGVKEVKGDVLTVQIPSYRSDILHEVDLIEDVAISYGIRALKPEMPFTPTIGRNLDITRFSGIARDVMIGFGFNEILSFVMSSPALLFKKMNRPIDSLVEVANPLVAEYSVLRDQLLPGLMDFLSYNRHVSYPQKIFECGDVVSIDEASSTRTTCQRRLAGAVSDHIASYEVIQSVVFGLLNNLNVSRWSIHLAEEASFINGRCASLRLRGSQIGILGEINPEVLERFHLENPVAAFEINLQECMKR